MVRSCLSWSRPKMVHENVLRESESMNNDNILRVHVSVVSQRKS